MKKILLIIILAIALILIVRASKKDEVVPLVAEENVVVITDQKLDTETEMITVGYAKLSKPGFVVVSTKDPKTGVEIVLGTSSLLPAGEHFNVKVKRTGRILSGTKTEAVVASLVVDNGDGTYSETDETLGGDMSDEATLAVDGEEDGDLSPEEIVGELENAGYTVNDDADALEDMSEDNSEVGDEMTEEDESSNEEEGAEQETEVTEETETPEQTGSF